MSDMAEVVKKVKALDEHQIRNRLIQAELEILYMDKVITKLLKK